MIYFAFPSSVNLTFRDESPKQRLTLNSCKLNYYVKTLKRFFCISRQVLDFNVVFFLNVVSCDIHVTFIIYLFTYLLAYLPTYLYIT